MAVIVCGLPDADRVEVVYVAMPPLSRGETASVLPPSCRNVTVPVGVPDAGELTLTVAVKVTDWPKVVALTDEVAVVVVVAGLMICVRLADVLPWEVVASPL